MPMMFPKMHIADSVVNRILNVVDEQMPVELQGAAVEYATKAPQEDMAMPEGIEDAIIARGFQL